MKTKRKTILAVSIAILVIALSLVVVFSENLASTGADVKLARVACLGDSITNMTSYPADLQALLGKNSVVGNFGYNGATINFNSDRTYYFSDEFHNARSFLPTTVIIMLGTNDARINVNQQINRFIGDYEHMISRIENFSSAPQIFLVVPTPIFNNTLDLNSTILTEQVIPLIQQVANSLDLRLIDVYTPLLNHPEYFPDGVHPNSEGAQIIADTIYDAINSHSK
jgi:lysophospholipase L1-like esterase